MKKQFFLLVVLFGAFNAQADEGKVYTWTDDLGVVHFSDTPYPEKEKYDVKEVRVDVTPHASSGPIITPREPLNSKKGAEEASYLVTITSPSNDETLRENSGNVTVTAVISPIIPAGAYYVLELDGVPQGDAQTDTTFFLENVDRGTHSTVVKVLTKDGKLIAKSPSVVFHLLRSAVGS